MMSLRVSSLIRFLTVPGAVMLGLLLLAGCGRDEVRVQQVPKERALSFAQDASAPQSTAASPGISWTVPQGWTDQGASGMRAGSFAATGPNGDKVDISVIALQSWTGQELGNVNRWRGQVGLAPISDAELPKETTQLQIAGHPAFLFDMAGTPPGDQKSTRIIVAVLPLPAVAWYFKMTGADAPVAEQKPAFLEFLKSVTFGQGAAPGNMASAPPETAMGEGSAANLPQWTVPENWKQEAPKQMQEARFSAPGPDNTEAEVSFAVLGGTGGGVLANVNRWRRQLGMEPVDQAGLGKITAALDVPAGIATLVDMTAEAKQTRIVAAIVPRGNATWFFRLSGPSSAVETQKAAFVKFVKSAQ